ncbi:MAG: hypothetical protein EZS28_032708 [Streblomastix strix]|uniref:Uncharacterized protein n=1 Tax=Streblomastix strix TaxID=222440 RepID=A0A5J4UPT5_9EUKA|nr:MAG: hypothetical protein EZS28_032708 [Streblomastix strix]
MGQPSLQRCITCDNPQVIPEHKIKQVSSSVIVIEQAARFYVICRMAPVVVDSIQYWRILACESCLAHVASCRQKQFTVERTIGFLDVVARYKRRIIIFWRVILIQFEVAIIKNIFNCIGACRHRHKLQHVNFIIEEHINQVIKGLNHQANIFQVIVSKVQIHSLDHVPKDTYSRHYSIYEE